MKDSFKNIWDNVFHQPENQFPSARINYVIPLISVTVCSSRKKLWSKVLSRRFPLERKPFSNGRNEGFVQKYIYSRRKKCFQCQESRKNIKKMVCTSQSICFHYSYWSVYWKVRFHYREKLFLQARKSKKMVSNSRKMFFFFIYLFPLISIMVSNSRKGSSEQKHISNR